MESSESVVSYLKESRGSISSSRFPDVSTRGSVKSKSRSSSANSVIGPTSRDISFLTDRGTKRDEVPKTKIPEFHHVKEKSVTPPLDPAIKAVFDEKSRTWQTTIFPSLQPSSRREVQLLESWLTKQLAENMTKFTDPLEAVKEAQHLYSIAFHEIIRQVWCQCKERGVLMEKIWNRYLELFEHMLQMREQEREQFSQSNFLPVCFKFIEMVEYQSTYQQMYKTKDEKFNKMYLGLASEKEKIAMHKDKLERAVLVLRSEYNKRMQREISLMKYIKKLRKQDNGNESDDVDLGDNETLIGPQSILLNVDTDSFSENNLLIASKLELVEEKIRSIGKLLSTNSGTSATTQIQIENLASAVHDVVKKISNSQDPSRVSVTYEDKEIQTDSEAPFSARYGLQQTV